MKNLRLHNLGTFKRVWVIGAVKGRASSLTVISKKILEKQNLLDRLVFTGNIYGPTSSGKNFSAEALDSSESVRSKYFPARTSVTALNPKLCAAERIEIP